jgi:hypothetical protein
VVEALEQGDLTGEPPHASLPLDRLFAQDFYHHGLFGELVLPDQDLSEFAAAELGLCVKPPKYSTCSSRSTLQISAPP